MAQALLPMIPAGATAINDRISVVREEGMWTSFCGIEPVFAHPEEDQRSFRMFTAQLIHRGTCRAIDLIRAFGVSKNSVLRSVAKYREEKVAGFFRSRRGRGATVMTAEVTVPAEALLGEGHTRREVAAALGVKHDTLRKAIEQGRVREPAAAPPEEAAPPLGLTPVGT